MDGHLRGPFAQIVRVHLRLNDKAGRSRFTNLKAREGEFVSVQVHAHSTQLRAEVVSTAPHLCRIRLDAADALSGSGQGVVSLEVRHRRAPGSSLEAIRTYRVLVPVRWTTLSA